jgi:hypothetical protein
LASPRDSSVSLTKTILTNQIPVAQWHEQIGDPTSADSILDRLVHNAYRIELESESMRKKRGGKERRFTPNVTGFAPESATDFSSESLTAFVGIRTYALTLFGGRRFNLAGRCGGSNLVARLLLSGLIVVEFLSTEAQECSAHPYLDGLRSVIYHGIYRREVL